MQSVSVLTSRITRAFLRPMCIFWGTGLVFWHCILEKTNITSKAEWVPMDKNDTWRKCLHFISHRFQGHIEDLNDFASLGPSRKVPVFLPFLTVRISQHPIPKHLHKRSHHLILSTPYPLSTPTIIRLDGEKKKRCTSILKKTVGYSRCYSSGRQNERNKQINGNEH